METPQSILDFWFGSEADDQLCARQQASLWWQKKPEVDNAIRERFAPTLRQAAAGELQGWLEHAQGRLALILLADQFTRNMYRDTAQAFEYDHLARNWCREGLRNGDHLKLRRIERVFFYLPMEHSEFLEDQQLSVSLFQQLHTESAKDGESPFSGFADYAQKHYDIVRRFGRFPHRNRILERESTPAEAAFLLEKGSSF
jgi:uncharacterized protein (DUF924 family)